MATTKPKKKLKKAVSELDRVKTVYLACIDLLQHDPQHGVEYEDDAVNEIYAEAANFVNAVENLGYDW